MGKYLSWGRPDLNDHSIKEIHIMPDGQVHVRRSLSAKGYRFRIYDDVRKELVAQLLAAAAVAGELYARVWRRDRGN